jgi:hypothetical protein
MLLILEFFIMMFLSMISMVIHLCFDFHAKFEALNVTSISKQLAKKVRENHRPTERGIPIKFLKAE